MAKAEEYYQNGMSRYKRGELDQALKSWQVCLREDPLHPGAIYHYTKIKDELEKKEKLVLLRKTGEKQYAANKFIDALVSWLRVRELEPSDSFARNYLDNIDQAFKAGVIKVSPGQDDEYFRRGLQAFRQQDFIEAVVLWEVSLKLNAGNEQARQGLNKARSTLINQKEQTSQEKQSQINGLLQEGLELYGSGKVIEALKKWITILKLDLENKDALDYIIVAKADISRDDYTKLCELHGLPADAPSKVFSDTQSIKTDEMLMSDQSDDVISLEMEGDDSIDLQEMADQVTDRTKIPAEMNDTFDTEMDESGTSAGGDTFSFDEEPGALELDGYDDEEKLDLDEDFTDILPTAPPGKKKTGGVGKSPSRMTVDEDTGEMIDDLSMSEQADIATEDLSMDDAMFSDELGEPNRENLFIDDIDDHNKKKQHTPAAGDRLDIVEGDLDDDYELDDEFIEEEDEEEEAIAAVQGTQNGTSTPVADTQNMIDKYFDRGFALFKSRKYEEAIIEWKKIFDIDRGNERAKDYIEKAITLYEASPFIEEHLSQGNKHLSDGKYEDAIAEFEKILEIDAELEDATKGIAKARQKLAEVVIPARKPSAPRPAKAASANAEQVLADIAARKKAGPIGLPRNRNALIAIGAVVVIVAVTLGYFFYLGPMKEKSRLQKLRIEQQQAMENVQGQIDMYIADAVVQMNLKDFDQAKQSWKQVLNLDPEHERAQRGMAEAEKLAVIYAHLNAGDNLLKDRKFVEAIAEFEKALALDPSLTTTQERIRDAQEKKLVYEEVKERVDVIVAQGKQHFIAKDYNRSIAFFRNALKLLPDDEESKEWIRRAEFEKRRGTNVEANLKLGLSRYESRKYEQAREYFLEVIKLDPNNKDALFYLKKIEEELSLY